MRKFMGRKMTTIDLLPESLQKRKRFRKLVIKLAAAQVAIFLCLGGAIAGLSILESQAWADSHELTIGIHALRHGPAVAAMAYAHELSQQLAAEDAFISAYAPSDFDPTWLMAILQADDEHMTELSFGGATFLLTGMVRDITQIEAHRQRLLDKEMFSSVGLGRIIMQDDGRFFYELHVRL